MEEKEEFIDDKESLDEEEVTDEDIKIHNIYETIQNTLYSPYMLYITSSVFKALNDTMDTNLRFAIITIYNATVIGVDYFKMLSDKEFAKEYESSPYNKLMSRINKKLKPIIFALNLTALSISGLPVLSQTFQEYRVEQQNPFDNQTTTLPEREIGNADAVEIIIDGVEDNILLTSEEIETIKNLKQYFEENPYLDHEQVYKNLSTVNVFYRKSEEKWEEDIAADYNRENNDVRIYNNHSINYTLPHEAIHASGNLEHRFLSEGLTSILESEYLFEGRIFNEYSIEILLTELVIELTSKDTVLQAFSEQNEALIVKKLEENPKCQDGKDFLDLLAAYTVTAKGLQEGKITEDEFLYYFTPTAERLVSYLENQEIDDWTKLYIKSLLYKTIEGNIWELPKFNYNKSKDHSYPEYINLSGDSISNQEEIYSRLRP